MKSCESCPRYDRECATCRALDAARKRNYYRNRGGREVAAARYAARKVDPK